MCYSNDDVIKMEEWMELF